MSCAGQFVVLAAELGRVLAAVLEVEIGRHIMGPKPLLKKFRSRGARVRKRNPIDRARLRRAIGWVDARCLGGPNCYRRALLEVALDRGAAAEPFRMGLKAHGGVGSGHAWLGSSQSTEGYDVELAL
jgi:hypothetical protein